MTEIRYVKKSDKEFGFRLDKHLPEAEYEDMKESIFLSAYEPYFSIWDHDYKVTY